MTTATSASILTQAAGGAPAGIDAWTGELVGQLIAVGLIQTQDTGQLTITGTGASATTNAAQPTGVGTANAVGHILLSFTDTLARGPISALAETTAGTGYTASATFTGIIITGATSGANTARATNVVSGGGVPSTTYTITTAGSGYIAGEKLTFSGGTDGGGHTFTTAGTAALGMPTALTSGTPVVLRLDFGAQNLVTDPQAWITAGSGSNGSGTINGSAGTTAFSQAAMFTGGGPATLVTAYSSYFCYSTTYGFCKVIFKVGAGSFATTPIGGFYLFRSNDTSGAATGAGVILIANAYNTSGATNTGSAIQCATYASGVITSIAPSTLSQAACETYPAIPLTTTTLPLGQTTFLNNGNVTIFNAVYQIGGVFSYTAYLGFGALTDLPQGNSFSTAIIGSTQLTFLGDSNAILGSTTLLGVAAPALATVSLWM